MRKIILFFILLLLISCDFSYYNFDYDIEISEFETDNLTLKIIKSWIKDNIKYENENIDCWQTPIETFKKKQGDCEDRAILFAWLAYQYLNKTGIFYTVFNRKKFTWHVIYKIDNFYFGTKYERNNNYFKDYQLVISHKYNYKKMLYLAEYIY